MSKKTKLIDPDRLVTPSEYAKLIGVTPAAVTKQMKTGKVNVIEIIGGKIIILPKNEK
jgi:predicted transcriptional regulator